MDIFWLVVDGVEWWWVVVDIFWLVVGRGGSRWVVVGRGGWWWVVALFSLTPCKR